MALVVAGWVARGITDTLAAHITISQFLSQEVGRTAAGQPVRVGDVLQRLVAERVAADVAGK